MKQATIKGKLNRGGFSSKKRGGVDPYSLYTINRDVKYILISLCDYSPLFVDMDREGGVQKSFDKKI